MEIRCRCSACQARFKVDGKYAGKKARCPKCQQVVEVPLQSLEGSTVTSAATLGLSQPLGNPPLAPPAIPTPTSGPVVPPKPARPAAGVSQSATFPKPVLPPPPTPPTPAAPAPATDPGPALPGFNFAPQETSGRGPGIAMPDRLATPALRAKKPKNFVPLAIGGSVALMALVGMAVVAVVAFSTPQSEAPKRRDRSTIVAGRGEGATLHLDWPASERDNARLSIDGRGEPLTKEGALVFHLAPGSHRVFIQRRGYEPIDAVVTLTQDKPVHYTPAWKSAAGAVAIASSASSSPITVSSGGDPAGGAFPIGTALGSLAPAGFEGWLQILEVAARQAKAENKDVLVLFGCSDGSPATQELARLAQRGEVKALIQTRFVPVVIDFPRGSEGHNLIEDTAQNDRLQQLYGIREVPVLALLDDEQRPYLIERQWENGIGDLLSILNSNQAQRGERDRLLSAAATGDDEARLVAAESAIHWLTEKKLLRHYRDERQTWMALAEKLDAANAAGRYEKFFEPQWLARIGDAVQSEDEPEILQAMRDLDPWLSRKFVDPDRGARVHMIAAQILIAAERHDDAGKHLERAASYEPRDKELRETLASVKQALQNKDVLGSGTGFLISPAGYMLTNHHVAAGEGRIEVRIPGTKETARAQLIASDEDRDIALLKVELPDAAKYARLAVLADSVRRGSEVAALGFPLGDNLGTQLKLTSGPISTLPDESNQGMILLDLTINPGNSGGPLCDRRGNVVGMITAKTGSFGFEDSYGLAIPAADLIKFLDQHLPADVPRVEPASAGDSLGWDEVDAKVSSGVLMILKKK